MLTVVSCLCQPGFNTAQWGMEETQTGMYYFFIVWNSVGFWSWRIFYKTARHRWIEVSRHVAFGSFGSESSPALQYGMENKDRAKTLYLRKANTHKKRKSVQLSECGLFLDKDYPLIGGCPNALVTCACCPDGLLQVKCCYKHRGIKPSEIPRVDRNYHIMYDKEKKLAVRPKSYWYKQIVGLLGITGKSYCDVVVYTDRGRAIIRVYRNEVEYHTIVEYSTYIYDEFILPEITAKCCWVSMYVKLCQRTRFATNICSVFAFHSYSWYNCVSTKTQNLFCMLITQP